MNESRHIAETEAEDYANEAAESAFAKETMDQAICDAVDDIIGPLLDDDWEQGELDDVKMGDHFDLDYADLVYYEADFYDDIDNS